MRLAKMKAVRKYSALRYSTILTQQDTLKLFAEHYDSVKAEPKGTNHANIVTLDFLAGKAFNAA